METHLPVPGSRVLEARIRPFPEWWTIHSAWPSRRNRVYRELLSLCELKEFFSAHLAVAQDLAQQTRPEGLPGVYRHHGVPSICKLKEMVTAADTRDPNPARPGAAVRSVPVSRGFRLMLQ